MFVCGVDVRLWIPKNIAEFSVQNNLNVQVRLNKTEERRKNSGLFFSIHLKVKNEPEYIPKCRCTNKTLGSRIENCGEFQSFAWSIIFIICSVFYGTGIMNALLWHVFTVIQHKLTAWELLQCIAPSHIKKYDVQKQIIYLENLFNIYLLAYWSI